MQEQKIETCWNKLARIVPTIVFCLIGAILILLVWNGKFVFGSEPGGWTYRYFQEETSILFWVPIVALLLIGALVFAGTHFIRRHEKTTLLVSLLAAIAVEILINSLYPVGVYDIINSTIANSFYPVSLRYSAVEFLRSFSSIVGDLPLHARTNMPGKVLFFHLLGLFTHNPRLLAYLVISVSTLGGLITYAICRRLFHDRIIAFYAFVLYCLVPSKLVFFPILNTVTPLFILVCLYLLILFINEKRWIFLVLLGISLYALVLFEPSPLMTGLIFVAVLINALGQKTLPPKDLIKVVAIPAAAFFAVYGIMRLAFSFDLFTMFAYMLKDAAAFNVGAERGYWVWVLENSKEFIYGVGTPVGLIFLLNLVLSFTKKESHEGGLRSWSMEKWFSLSLLATYLVVLLLGINRGETTRLWIYLAVFFQIPTAVYMGKSVKNHWLFFLLAATMAVQAMAALQRVNFIIP